MCKIKSIAKFSLILIVMLIVAWKAMDHYYLNPSWEEKYAFENDEIIISIRGKKLKKSPELANVLVIRLTGNSRREGGWGVPANPHVENGFYHARDVNELHEVTTWFTDEYGKSPFPGYQTKGYGSYGLLGSSLRGGAILGLIYKPGYEYKRINLRSHTIESSTFVLSKPKPSKAKRANAAEKRLIYELKLYNGPLNILFPFVGVNLKEQHLAEVSTFKYLQHVLPNGQTIRGYAVNDLIRINNSVENQYLKKYATELIAILSKKPLTLEAIRAAIKYPMKFNYSDIAYSMKENRQL